MGSPGSGTGNSNTHTSSSFHTRYGRTGTPLYHYTGRSRCTVYTMYIWECSGAPDFCSGDSAWAEVLSSSGHPRRYDGGGGGEGVRGPPPL
ncbi:unnamed protein product [Macrosiphum euphorbiae]|uniref:Uncharacterized protein n=1 Tax=Macrosiphum euphorbiae TaxID=13131 RepID=A0AAV0W2A9_9HEMI|nr:unnamed protein product [Macrosiphum euphorbiae]